MNDDIFTDEDLQQSDRYETLGPAYFAARRAAESLMVGATPEPLAAVAKKVADDINVAVYAYIEGSLLCDLEINLHHHIQRMVESTVEALLSGKAWAMKQYPLGPYNRGEEIRAAVAKHGGEPLLMARIADLEKEIARLTESLKWHQR